MPESDTAACRTPSWTTRFSSETQQNAQLTMSHSKRCLYVPEQHSDGIRRYENLYSPKSGRNNNELTNNTNEQE